MSLPRGYTRLEYIESTGTQYIDTGIYASDDLMIKLQITPNPNYLSEYSILGVEWSLNGFFLMFYQNAIRFHSKGTSVDVTSFNKSSKNEIVCKSNSLTVNGAVYMLSGGGTNSQTYQIRLFSVANEGSFPSSSNKRGHFKLWQTQVYNGSTLIRDFIPCKNASGEVGLWDDVNSQFYTNAGTGAFTAGPPIVDLTAHKTLVGGTAYNINGGKCMVGGTVYSIKKGRTLVGGTGYDINFEPDVSKTWTFDTSKAPTSMFPNLSAGSTQTFSVSFTSNGERYIGFVFSHYSNSDTLGYATSSGSITVYDFRWESAYATVTFDEAPSGDLLTWMQANATPQ